MTGDDTGGDDQPPSEAGVDADIGLQPPKMGFQFQSPSLDAQPGQDITWCYYFHTPNTSDVEISMWESELTNVQSVVMYTTSSDLKTPGTIDSAGCGYKTTSIGPTWVYQSQIARDKFEFPADDGNHNPVGFPIRAGQSGYLQIHMVNTGTDVLHGQVKINGNTYATVAGVTEAGPLITYSNTITIGPGTATSPATATATGICSPMPTNVQFFSMSTHTFRHGTHTMVTDTPKTGAATTVFEGTDWQKPNDVSQIKPGAFRTFTGSLTYRCDYENTEATTIVSGDNAKTDEICIAVGYFFPSPGGANQFCLNNHIYTE